MIYSDEYESDGETYEVVAQAGEYGYEWHQAALLRKDGELFFAADSGCSCNSFGDYGLTPTPVASWQQAIELAKEEFGDGSDSYDGHYATNFAEACLRARQEGRL